MMYLFHSGRKLLLTSAVYDMRFRTQTKCCSCSIHSHVSTTYNSHLFGMHDRSIGIRRKGLHQIAPGQILIGREHTVCLLTGNSHKFRKSGTGTDKDSRKAFFFHQIIDRYRLADYHIGLDLHTKGLDIFNFLLNNIFFGKTEFRNAVNKHSSGLMQCLKDRYIIAQLCQISRTGQTGRTGADNSHLLTVLFLCSLRLDSVLFCPVSYKTLQLSDGDCLPFNATDTFSFTLALLRADTAADCRKCRRLTDDLICLLDIAKLYLLDKARNIDGYRTSLHALRIFAVDTPFGLTHRFFFIITKTDLFKIGCSFLCILFSDRYFF